ncbi:glycosyltransferase family 4 protein [Metabacillus arenae]|uniref:Glycosyltransferase family 4 protein n=1 Tax=Metabacillus arenae TaxID=2771434 RepID=A0A926NSC0_9BACI|nr:glycosyltransferase family 4 protein [Metabacillus arenae]MBD1383001.1 glycosyltransferase family 4 protein [Metabacillus arenae]
MKICHLTSVHPSEDIRILIKECQSLAKAGHDVSLIVANHPSDTKYGVNIIGVKAASPNRFFKMVKGPISVYKQALKEDADVYHFHDPELMPVGLLLKKNRKKVIYDVHEDVPEQVLSKEWIPKPLRRLISKVVKAVEKYSSQRFDAVVAATPTIAGRFQTYNSSTATIHNFPILNELHNGAVEQGENHNSTSDGNVLYIGGITALRGIEEMMEAVEKINARRPARLLLAGKFAPASLEEAMKEKPGWKYVNHLGWLSRDQIKRYLSSSDVGLVLLHPEPRYVVSYPIKLFEYMSAGLPVIASNFPLWKEIVEGNQCGKCIDPLDTDAAADAIQWFLDNPEEAKQMGENGRRAIEEKYNWETESEHLIELYDHLSHT